MNQLSDMSYICLHELSFMEAHYRDKKKEKGKIRR